MNKAILILLIFTLIFSCKTKEEQQSPQETAIKIKAMTYNIRLNTPSDGENAWPYRKEALSSQVLIMAPDVLGVQEAVPGQMQDLKLALADYNFIGHGRDGDDKGEFSAIFYNKNNLKVIEHSTFWLSETPIIISKGWDAAYPRICTYGLFSSKENDKKFWVFNTHLDHVGEEAKKQGMNLILNTISEKNKDNYPVFLMGDFNVEPNSEVVSAISKTMKDTRSEATVVFGSDGTFNGFKYDEPVNRRIDYIFVSPAAQIKVNKYAVLSSLIDFKYPSDHFPVFTEVVLK